MALRAAIGLAALLVVLGFARYALATRFQPYDDEGYLLLSLDHYLQGGHLYTETFSQYGPFFSYAQAALFRLLQLPVNTDAGRLVTLLCWLLSAGLGGYFIYRLSHDIVLAAAATLACGSLASVLANEPGHPQQVILPILMLACCASVPGGRGRFGLLLLGGLGAALLFTKINVGVFYFAALAQALVCSFSSSRARTVGAGLLLAYAAAAPLLLMQRDAQGDFPWARGYCLLATLVGVAALLAGWLTRPAAGRPIRGGLYAAAGAVSVGVLIVIGTMLQGMSLATLLDAVLWVPLGHPGVYSVPLLVPLREVCGAVLITAGIAALYRFGERAWTGADWVGALRCAVGLCAMYLFTINVGYLVWVLPFLPLGLIPVNGVEWRPCDFFPRVFLSSLAAAEFLQAYPVAGSQLNIAAMPALLWALLCIHDGAGGLFNLVRRATGWGRDSFPGKSVLGGAVALACTVAMLPSVSWSRRYPDPASHLRGAASLHLPAPVEARYLFLADSIRANCDILFSLPGLGSLNYWSGVPAPNGSNLNAWMRGMGLDRQQQILDILRANPRACSVYNAELVSAWDLTTEELDALPLAHYILYDMRAAAQRDGYEIRVHPQRTSPWIAASADAAGVGRGNR
jgi:hypothetical protein